MESDVNSCTLNAQKAQGNQTQCNIYEKPKTSAQTLQLSQNFQLSYEIESVSLDI